MEVLLSYLVIINLLGVLLMGTDKRRAVRGKWRIPEKTLFLVALAGGSPGILFGMQAFRHKTKHEAFRFGVPALLLGQLVLAAVLVRSGALDFLFAR